MALSRADEYYLKAKDGYPFNLEESITNLNYAYSYDAEHVGVNFLLGLIYWEQFSDAELAQHYFECALVNNPKHLPTLLQFIQLAIDTRQLDLAQKLIMHATKIPSNKGAMLTIYTATLLELQNNPKAALESLLKVNELIVDEYESELVEEIQKRLELKIQRHYAQRYVSTVV